MKATMQLRWFSTVNEVTQAMILAEREATDEPLMVCKKKLEGATVPVLQQWFDTNPEGCDEDAVITGEWRTVNGVLQKIPAK